MAATFIRSKDKLCPECGDFVVALDHITGWCRTCTALINRNTRTAIEEFLEVNADFIEHYMLQGNSVNQAIDLMKAEISRFRTCASCGGFIKRGGRHSVFCRKKPQCRKFSRQYVYLYQNKGLSKAEALSQVLTTINGSE